MKKQLYKPLRTTRTGFTSFYIVIFASLLFTIIVVSFVSIITSSTNSNLNDELSQSAYDSALAGVEDAKIAIVSCLSSGSSSAACNSIITTQNTYDPFSPPQCEAIPSILGRTYDANIGVIVSEGSVASEAAEEMTQAYTCVTATNNLIDYRSHISATDSDNIRMVPLRAGSDTGEIKSVRISWYASSDSQRNVYDFRDTTGSSVTFRNVSNGYSMPPTLSVQLLQTSSSFKLVEGELDYTNGSTTDRGTLLLAPSKTHGVTTISSSDNPNFLKANDKRKQNDPAVVKCDDSGASEFICNVILDLPSPVQSSNNPLAAINGTIRNPTTAFLVLQLPYGQPSTDFAVQLCSNDIANGSCWDAATQEVTAEDSIIRFINAQYAIDSTGRANDIYRRVETRIELADTYFPYPQYAVHITDGGELSKNFWTTVEPGTGQKQCWWSDNEDGTDGQKQACSADQTSGSL